MGAKRLIHSTLDVQYNNACYIAKNFSLDSIENGFFEYVMTQINARVALGFRTTSISLLGYFRVIEYDTKKIENFLDVFLEKMKKLGYIAEKTNQLYYDFTITVR